MGILSKIYIGTKKIHQETENKPYLTRYKGTDLTLIDHYRHLCQLLPVYEIIENKLKEQGFSPKLPEELSDLLNRSEKIRADLIFLEKSIPPGRVNRDILDMTKQYVNYLNSLETGKENNKIFAQFLVRILGDLYGGQHIKNYVEHLYSRKKILSNDTLNQGIHFYFFKEGALKHFSQWLNDQEIGSGDELVFSAQEAFKKHIDIFDELEKTRSLDVPNYSRFFNFKNACMVGAAIVGAGLVYVSTVSRPS